MTKRDVTDRESLNPISQVRQLAGAIADNAAYSTQNAERVPQGSVIWESSILDGLNDEERQLVLSKCVEQRFEKGAYLCVQGGEHTENFLLESGIVRTFYTSPLGKEITLGYWSAGDLLGGPNFFDNCVHIWSAQAVKNSIVFKIKASDFRELTLQFPRITERVIATLTFKLYWFSLLFQMLGTESVNRRIAHLLLILTEIYGVKRENGTTIKYKFTHEEIGNMVGATRQWVTLALGNLQREGIVQTTGEHLIVVDVPLLKKYLESPC